MIRAKNFFMQCVNTKVGGGGWHCPCCGPTRRDLRKKAMRAYRKRFNALVKKIEKLEE